MILLFYSKSHPVFKSVPTLSVLSREDCQEHICSYTNGCQREIYVMVNLVGFAICVSDLGEELKKKDFAVDWTLLGSGDNFVIRYFKNLEGKKNGARLKLWWVKKQQSFILSSIEFFWVIFVIRAICFCPNHKKVWLGQK